MKLRLSAAAAAAAAFVMANPAQAALVTLDFESDAPGVLGEGFASADYSGLQFFTDLGAGLELGNYGVQSDGQGLLARNDSNGNFIKGVFSDGPHSFLSMDFGNDDPFFTNPGDRAVLTVFLGAAMVGQTFVIMNRNDVMDQTIGFNFGSFDNFTLAFTNAAGSVFTGGGAVNVGLIEVIDNITFDVPDTVVPEPATWAMMILGFAGTGALLRRRRAIALI
ncbi:PEPxxWA-CTERM sorting domain-containing protein [Phenylobacterium sp.]|uniref:PEPxxWA-CTERM sorting domain-containing protein n=1 Tax=Phenylobacterium sp. TaxID=1871053 RepID=UPI0025DCBA6B|nr:PEPxxWA-CTERM sorting domain-containing protein [Phenylobacterium sp.]